MYELNTQVRFSMCDEGQKLSVGGMVDCFQDVCNMQAYRIGVGSDYLALHRTAWVLNTWNIHINRFPQMYETVKVFTWPYEFKGFFGFRNFKMEDSQGEIVAYADSIWTLIDINTGRPVKVTEEIRSQYTIEEAYPMEHISRKLLEPECGDYVGGILLGRHHLDLNHHMNNVQYVREAADYLPQGFAVGRIMVEYRRQTRLGEKIQFYKTTEENCVTIVMKEDNGDIHAIVKFEEKSPEVE